MIAGAVAVVAVIAFLVWFGRGREKAGADDVSNAANTKVLNDAQAVADARNDPANLERVRNASFRD